MIYKPLKQVSIHNSQTFSIKHQKLKNQFRARHTRNGNLNGWIIVTWTIFQTEIRGGDKPRLGVSFHIKND